jgi:guanine deaminase
VVPSRDVTAWSPREEFMQAAIDDVTSHLSLLEGGPFGACIVRGNEVISVAHNTVLKCNDPTNHAEMNAIRAASLRLQSYDLTGAVIYSTTEPCPMCFAAIHWARIEAIVFGSSIGDARRLGFNELAIDNVEMARLGESHVQVYGDFMREACLAVFERWRGTPGHATY